MCFFDGIGRAIRHRGDYAVVLLLDVRYGEKRIQEFLPGWLRKCRVEVPGGFGDVMVSLSQVCGCGILWVLACFGAILGSDFLSF